MDLELLFEIAKICIDGLCTDGDHHKQWYLEEVLKKLGFSEEALTMFRDHYQYERGRPG